MDKPQIKAPLDSIDPLAVLAASFLGHSEISKIPGAFSSLCELFKSRRVAAGDHIFRENDTESYMALIASGEVDIIKTNVHLRKKTLITLNAGDLLGEMSFVDGGSRSAGARAKTEVNLLTLSRGDFDELSKENLALAHAFLREVASLIARRLKETSQRAQNS